MYLLYVLGDEQWRIHLWMPVEKTPNPLTPPPLRGSNVSKILQGDPALGSERNTLHSRCLFTLLEPLAVAPYSSSSVWLGHRISHPQEMPPSGPGRDPSISTPGESVCGIVGWGGVGDGGMLPSLQVRDLGTTWGPSPPPTSLLGECPVQCPFHGHLPPPSCAGA